MNATAFDGTRKRARLGHDSMGFPYLTLEDADRLLSPAERALDVDRRLRLGASRVLGYAPTGGLGLSVAYLVRSTAA